MQTAKVSSTRRARESRLKAAGERDRDWLRHRRWLGYTASQMAQMHHRGYSSRKGSGEETEWRTPRIGNRATRKAKLAG